MVQLLVSYGKMIPLKGLFITFLLLVTIKTAKANYLERYLLESEDWSEDTFLEQISFVEIFKLSPSTMPYKRVEGCLEAQNRNSALFFLELAQHKVEIQPIESNNKSSLVEYLELGAFLIEHEDRLFQIASDVIFVELVEKLNKGFEVGLYEKSDQLIMDIVAQLNTYQYGVSIPISNLEKGVHHIKKGNLKYIWSRLWFDYSFACVAVILLILFGIYRLGKKIKK